MKRFGRVHLGAWALLTLLPPAGSLAAQTAVVAVDEENFRAAPSGDVLATLLRGTSLAIGEARGPWREATVEGWIWGRSVREQQREELNLLVNASGENLRASPNGERIGRAAGGMLLQRLETRGNWLRVRRTGWIWSESIALVDDSASAARRPAGEPPAGEPAPTASPAPPPSTTRTSRHFEAVREDAVLLDNAAGDTVARLWPETTVEVLAQEGEWTRVRLEGWVLSGAFVAGDGGSTAVLRQISRDSLQAHPNLYRGRLLEWTLQFIALQEAERFRTDFIPGEPFMLTRGPGDDSGFVYVAVGGELLERVRSLSPLQQVRVLARVRSVRSSLTGAPVLDLLEITGR